MSIKGNPVQFRDGPAAVISSHSSMNGILLTLCCHCPVTGWEGRLQDGKVRRPAWNV